VRGQFGHIKSALPSLARQLPGKLCVKIPHLPTVSMLQQGG
jgi:hypothetical protein